MTKLSSFIKGKLIETRDCAATAIVKQNSENKDDWREFDNVRLLGRSSRLFAIITFKLANPLLSQIEIHTLSQARTEIIKISICFFQSEASIPSHVICLDQSEASIEVT